MVITVRVSSLNEFCVTWIHIISARLEGTRQVAYYCIQRQDRALPQAVIRTAGFPQSGADILDELLEMHEQEQDIEQLESLGPVQSEDRMAVNEFDRNPQFN
ncbi:hypothetical protein TNCV_4443521 [Trichonephila clavipes]|nr:hypothetical protein TNCV_4443521 [Trichonephila clavipes]